MQRLAISIVAVWIGLSTAWAGTVAPREGWSVIDTRHAFPMLVERLEQAVEVQGMNVVNVASASDGAKALGVSIPGNRVVGVFRNDLAQRMLKASVAAGIEAPIRFYVTENPDGTGTLSFHEPSSVFAPYFAEGGDALKTLASELDGIFAGIAAEATTAN